MSGPPEDTAESPPTPDGIDPDYPRLLKELEEQRRAADQALLRKMVDMPDPHP